MCILFISQYDLNKHKKVTCGWMHTKKVLEWFRITYQEIYVCAFSLMDMFNLHLSLIKPPFFTKKQEEVPSLSPVSFPILD